MQSYNEIKLTGVIKKVYPLVTTINNVNVARFILEHQSVLKENNQLRKVFCKMFCVVVGSSNLDNLLNCNVKILGFVSTNSQQQLVLHVNEIEKLN